MRRIRFFVHLDFHGVISILGPKVVCWSLTRCGAVRKKARILADELFVVNLVGRDEMRCLSLSFVAPQPLPKEQVVREICEVHLTPSRKFSGMSATCWLVKLTERIGNLDSSPLQALYV